MRLAPCLLLPALVSAAKSSLGSLYLYDEQASGQTSTLAVKADTARLIIASYLGLDRFHSLSGQDEDSLQTINRVAPAESLFSPKHAASVALILSSVSKHELPFPADSAHLEHLQIKDAPSFQASEKLVDHLAIQSGLQVADTDMRSGLVSSFDGPVFRIAQTQEDLASTFDTLTRQHYTVLTLNVPNDTTTTKNTYGNYDMPSSTHQKRQFKEAPLITDTTKTVSPLKATLTPNANNSPNTPLKGILPQCFSTLSACQSQTRNCTGHGACVLLHTDQDADVEGKCFACSCKADVRTNKDGSKKTTRWGGPACQKKDVVMPFWLIATFTVFFAFVVSWGIGLLYTMGSQELPSVIGAGVSGVPRAK